MCTAVVRTADPLVFSSYLATIQRDRSRDCQGEQAAALDAAGPLVFSSRLATM